MIKHNLNATDAMKLLESGEYDYMYETPHTFREKYSIGDFYYLEDWIFPESPTSLELCKYSTKNNRSYKVPIVPDLRYSVIKIQDNTYNSLEKLHHIRFPEYTICYHQKDDELFNPPSDHKLCKEPFRDVLIETITYAVIVVVLWYIVNFALGLAGF